MLYNLLSDSKGVSHKRLISLLSFLCLITLMIANISGVQVDSNLIFVFGGLTIGSSTLSVIDKKQSNGE